MSPLLLLATALAQPLVGEAVSFGNSPVHTTVDAVEGGLLVQVYWPAFDRHTLEVIVPTDTDCGGEGLETGRARVAEPVQCVDVWVDEPHPVYDMRSPTHLRCVIGPSEGVCKLGYTPWFTVQPAPAPRSVRDAPRRR